MVCVGYEMVVFVRIEVCVVVRWTSIGLLASRTGLRVAVGTEETSARTGGHYERGYYCCVLFGCRARKIKGDPWIEKNHLKYVSSSYVRCKYSLFYDFSHRSSQRRYQAWLWSLYHRPSNDLSQSFICLQQNRLARFGRTTAEINTA